MRPVEVQNVSVVFKQYRQRDEEQKRKRERTLAFQYEIVPAVNLHFAFSVADMFYAESMMHINVCCDCQAFSCMGACIEVCQRQLEFEDPF